MKINYKWLYKLVLIANKNPNKTYYLDFSSDCLNANRDFNWNYEDSKTNWVRKFIKDSIEQKFTRKEIKSFCKNSCKDICFYDEHISRAKYITKRYKEK
jgi:hypothetical protein